MAHSAGNYGEGYVPFSFDQPVVNDGGSGPLPEVPTQPQVIPDQPDDALSKLWELAQDDPSYMETYLQALAERENTTNAQAWYEKMSGSQYQRAMEDLKKAGLNPWLALQSLNGAGSGSVQPASTWSTSPYANKLARERNQIDTGKMGIQALSTVAGLVIGALIALI